MEHYILPVVLVLYLAYREYLTSRERSSMLDRLMSRDLDEFKAHTEQEDNEDEPVDDGTVAIEDAEEMIMEENG